METSFSRQLSATSSAFLNRIRDFFQTQGAINSPYPIPLFVTAPTLLELLQLKYQSSNNTPFETHPISMYLANASILASCLAYASLRLSSRRFSPTCLNIVRFCTWCFGQLSLAALAAVMFPNSVTFVPYVVYFILAVGELVCCFYYRTMGERLREWLFQGRFGIVVQQFLTSMQRRGMVQLRDWRFQERLGLMQQFLMNLPRRIVNVGINQTEMLPVHVARGF